MRTSLPRDKVVSILSEAMLELSTRTWPLPKPHLRGEVQGGTFTCHPRTSAFGGNAVPAVSGEIISRSDGGTDVVVRVVEWFVFLLFGLVTIGGAIAVSHAESVSDAAKGIGVIMWMLLCAAGIYAAEAVFVRSIFARLFSDSP